MLDGDLSDAGWQNTDVATNFQQFFPYDTSLANSQTEIRVAYDDHFIYIGAKMFNLGSRKYVTPSLRRDYRGEANDGISVVLDTFKDKTNAFIFGVNPFGVQREGLVGAWRMWAIVYNRFTSIGIINGTRK
ncbi:MAG: carbohydrate binding family 9 domain-containing protein [Cytophagales bacterium]|nr:carbohydrate binding family 9 domain-containing protein [Cytophagales bacterium]